MLDFFKFDCVNRGNTYIGFQLYMVICHAMEEMCFVHDRIKRIILTTVILIFDLNRTSVPQACQKRCLNG